LEPPCLLNADIHQGTFIPGTDGLPHPVLFRQFRYLSKHLMRFNWHFRHDIGQRQTPQSHHSSRYQIVSVHIIGFFPKIRRQSPVGRDRIGITCADYTRMPPRKSSISWSLRKMADFWIGNGSVPLKLPWISIM